MWWLSLNDSILLDGSLNLPGLRDQEGFSLYEKNYFLIYVKHAKQNVKNT